MDNSLVIATVTVVSSFLTVLVTSMVNMWGKWVDSNQKVNEHRLSIRSLYITQKIEASQAFISNTAIRANKHHFENHFYTVMIREKRFRPDILEKLQEIKNKQIDQSISYDKAAKPIGAFYNLSEYQQQCNAFEFSVNEIRAELNGKPLVFDEATVSKMRQIISINEQMIDVLRSMNKMIRDSLAKYDVL